MDSDTEKQKAAAARRNQWGIQTIMNRRGFVGVSTLTAAGFILNRGKSDNATPEDAIYENLAKKRVEILGKIANYLIQHKDEEASKTDRQNIVGRLCTIPSKKVLLAPEKVLRSQIDEFIKDGDNEGLAGFIGKEIAGRTASQVEVGKILLSMCMADFRTPATEAYVTAAQQKTPQPRTR